MIKLNLLFLLLFGISINSYTQIETPVKWSYGAKRMGASDAVLFIKATVQKGWHIYSINQKPGGPLKTSFLFSPSDQYKLVGSSTEPKPITIHDETFDMDVSYFENSVIFQQKVRLNGATATVKGHIKYMVCSGEKCVPDDIDFIIPIR